jgi:hypothetical protein
MKEIASALVKAQKAFGPVLKNKRNGHLKQDYADLQSVLTAVTDALNDNGIMLMQQTHDATDGVVVETIFLHESGEQISGGKLHIITSKFDPQGFGSALSYARRYSLMAACGVASEDEDDDAEGATYRHPKDVAAAKEQKKEAPPMISAEQAIEIDELIESTKSDRAGLLHWVSKNTNTNCADVSMIPNVAYVHVKKMLTKKAEKVTA